MSLDPVSINIYKTAAQGYKVILCDDPKVSVFLTGMKEEERGSMDKHSSSIFLYVSAKT